MKNLDTNANRKVKNELAESTNYTRNKNKLLLKIAKAVVNNPEAKSSDIVQAPQKQQFSTSQINEESRGDNLICES